MCQVADVSEFGSLWLRLRPAGDRGFDIGRVADDREVDKFIGSDEVGFESGWRTTADLIEIWTVRGRW